jgi:hypothetical protein
MKTCGDYKPMTKNNSTMSNHMALLASKNYAFWQCQTECYTDTPLLGSCTHDTSRCTRHAWLLPPRESRQMITWEMTNHDGRGIFIKRSPRVERVGSSLPWPCMDEQCLFLPVDSANRCRPKDAIDKKKTYMYHRPHWLQPGMLLRQHRVAVQCTCVQAIDASRTHETHC